MLSIRQVSISILLAGFAVFLPFHSALCQPSSLEQELFEFFSAYCANGLANLDRSRSAAKVYGWQPLSADLLKMGAPNVNGSELEGWLVQRKSGNKYVLAISKSQHGNGCSVLNSEFEPQKLVNMFSGFPNVQEAETPNAFGQRQKAWTTKIGKQEIIISLVYSINDGELGGSLGAATVHGAE